MSETTSESTDASASTVPHEDPTPFGWLNTTDHKRIGRLFIIEALVFLALGAVLDVLVRIDLTDSADFVVLDVDTFAQVFALSRESLVLLFLVPAFLGLAMYVVPLQIGAGNLAFPRAAAASFWGWLVSAGVLIGAYLGNGGPYGGWSDGVDLHLLAVGGIVLSLLLGAVVVAATVLTHRAPGMFMDRTAPFTWSALVTSSMLVIGLPVVLGQLVLLYVDHRHGAIVFGGNFGVWERIDWIHETPTLFIYMVPVLGITAEIMLAAARRRVFEPLAMYFTMGLLGLFGFGAWANFSVTTEGRDIVDGFEGVVLVGMYGGASVAILALLGVLGFTVFQSRKLPKLTTPVLAAFGAGTLLLLGAVYGLLGAASDWLEIAGRGNDDNPFLNQTTWVTGQQSILVYGAGVLGLVAALHWWSPKIWGRSLNDMLGMLTVLAVALGAVLATVGPALSGALAEQPDFVYGEPALTSTYADFLDASGAEGYSGLGVAGVIIVLAGGLLLGLNLAVSLALKKGAESSEDPWSAMSPEWLLPSPPPLGVADALPVVDSGTPLLDREEADASDAEEVTV